MVARKPGSPGRSRRKPLKPLRRECRNVPVDLWWTYSCAFLFCARGCGCTEAPAFPAPSFIRGDMFVHHPGAFRAAAMRACVVIPGRDSEPGISRFRVWSFGPSRNDSKTCCLTCESESPRDASLSTILLRTRRSDRRHVRACVPAVALGEGGTRASIKTKRPDVSPAFSWSQTASPNAAAMTL